MERCKTCRHYAAPDDGGSRRDQEKGRCLLAGSSLGDPINPESLAVAQDGESAYAWLEVAPDFGCVQHAPQDSAP